MKQQANHSRVGGEPRPPREDVNFGPVDIRSISLTGLFLFALLYSIYFGRVFLVPVALAFLLSMLFRPAVRRMKDWHVPEALSSAVFILGLFGLLGYGAYRLAEPARQWIQSAPESIRQAELKLRGLLAPLKEVQKTTKKLEDLTSLGDDAAKPNVELRQPGLGAAVFTGTQEFLFSAGVTLVLLYFLLASGDLFLLKLVRVLPTLEDKKLAVEISRQIESDISRYLTTITVINVGLGCAIGGGLYLVGLPNAALWGVMAALLNFIPYLGALIGISVTTVAAFVTFDEPLAILAVPAIYFGMNILEAYLVTPLALSRSLSLNPVVIFIWLVFWGWVWGVVGAFLAVPLLAVLKIICDQLAPLAAIGEFLGSEESGT